MSKIPSTTSVPRQKTAPSPQPAKPKAEPKEFNTFYCETCNTAGMSYHETVQHLAEAHKLTGDLKHSRRMLMHGDARDHFVYLYELTFPCGVTLRNEIKQQRRRP